MPLSNSTLDHETVKKFAKLVQLLRDDPMIKEPLRRNFKTYLKDRGSMKPKHPTKAEKEDDALFSEVDVTRIIDDPIKRPYRKIVQLYDYVMERFVPERVRSGDLGGKTSQTVLELHTAIGDDVARQVSEGLNPLLEVYSKVSGRGEPIPEALTDVEYIGYRRSSNASEVIRFYLRLQATQDRDKVIFKNEYYRHHAHWIVDGFGVWSKNTLNLFGHAEDHRTGRTLGYRTMALSDLGVGGVLTGPLISMDDQGPIAARIVLIPFEEHDLTERQEAMSKGDLIDDFINPKSIGDNKKYLQEVKENLSVVFEGYPDNHIYKLISNFTLSTIKAIPREYDPVVERELVYRRLVHQAGWDLGMVEGMIAKALEQVPEVRLGGQEAQSNIPTQSQPR